MKKNHMIILVAAMVLLALGSTVGVLAKYRSQQTKQAEMVAADFHFSSDYLEETPKTYSVSGWPEGITLELYNYEKENPALVSALEVEYFVSVSSDQFEVVDNGTGKLPAMTAETAKVTIRPKTGTKVTETELTVTVDTTPYNEGLSASFTLVGGMVPTYQISGKPEDTHYTVKVYANHYEGNVTLKWTDKLIPDAANDVVTSTWATEKKGTFAVEPFHTYEIIFFNPEGVSSSGIGFAE